VICSNCGQRVAPGTTFCGNCGTRAGGASGVSTTKEVVRRRKHPDQVSRRAGFPREGVEHKDGALVKKSRLLGHSLVVIAAPCFCLP